MFIIFGIKPRKVKVDFVPLFPIQSSKSVESVLACPKCDMSHMM